MHFLFALFDEKVDNFLCFRFLLVLLRDLDQLRINDELVFHDEAAEFAVRNYPVFFGEYLKSIDCELFELGSALQEVGLVYEIREIGVVVTSQDDIQFWDIFSQELVVGESHVRQSDNEITLFILLELFRESSCDFDETFVAQDVLADFGNESHPLFFSQSDDTYLDSIFFKNMILF